ncbi:T9SS type A sorting domain-containing protein [Mucilaginibacter sp. OK098]|uniref:T9SS type A sorting domain-containing protein n=1 Tax=Mucilaginibacter sp. OK098 TaxID=1855297 RepID=UPI00135633A7|nr:T9SS type A sorting domain-containing protein [Mucilaginibacter sp. OK098]
MKTLLLRFFLLCFFSFLFAGKCLAVWTFDWTGSSSTSWTNSSNWSRSGSGTAGVNYPGQLGSTTDIVQIAVNYSLNTANCIPVLSTAGTTKIAKLIFGGSFTSGNVNYPGISVSSGCNLTVTGDINVITDTNPGSYTYNGGTLPTNQFQITGAGTLQATNMYIYANYGSSAAQSTQQAVISSIANLILTGNMVLTSENYYSFFTLYNQYASFYLNSGTTEIDGVIQTLNTVSGTVTYPTSTLQINPSSSAGAVLKLVGATALSGLSASGTNVVDVNNTYTTVNYSGTSQTVYTSTAANVSGGMAYYNLTLSGGTETPASGTLAVANDFTTTGGGAVNLNTNNPTVTVGNNWTNAANVTQGAGNITVTNVLQNTSGTIQLGTGNLTTSTLQNSGGTIAGGAGPGVVTVSNTFQNNGGTYQCNAENLYINGGTYQNTSTFTAGSGTVYFNGTAAQSLSDISTSGTQFNKVSFSGNTLANAKTMSGSGGFAVSSTGILTMVGATTTLDAGGVLTLRSASTSSAAVDIITSPSVIKGLVYVERFLNGGSSLTNRGYRLLSSPVSQTSLPTTASNTYGLFYLNTSHTYGGITSSGAYTAGPGGSGFSTSNNNATIYLYDESQIYNGKSFTLGNHVPVNAIAATTETVGATSGKTIPIGNGFLMYFVGATGRANATTAILPTDATLTANGYINQGTFTVKLWTGLATLSYTTGAPSTHPYPGLNMVGNPYPSTIDLSVVLSQNLTQINSIYVLSARNSPNQKYIAYTPNGTSAPSAGYAVSGEGFFVTAKGPANTNALTFNESQKVPATQLTGAALIMSTPNAQVKGVGGQVAFGQNSLAAAVPQGDALTGLYMKIERDSATYDYCGIYFRKDWSATFAEDDAKDMNATSGPVVMSSLSADNIRASVNHMPDYTKGVNVKLYANASTNGQYKLKIEDIRNIDTLYNIYLIDHYKKDSLDIRRYGTYLFDISKADTSSYGGSRFELSVRPRPLPVYRLLNFTAQKVSGGVQVSWKTEAESNYTGFVLQKQDGTTFDPLYSKQGDGGGIYTFIDPSPVTGANTYRLQQDNIVGAISLSPAITIIYNPAGQAGLMSVYPNPTKATISVNVSSMTSAAPTYKANIYNSAGQMMMQRSVSSNSWTEDVTQYTPGTYIIQLKDNSGNLIGKSKFVKTN